MSVSTLSIVPPVTFHHFLRITGYTVTFLLVRQMVWQFSARPWNLIFPILGIGALEAAIGLSQFFAGGHAMARGTYVNRNHFAGLLEMVFPFALMYPLALLGSRKTWWRNSSVVPAVQVCLTVILASALLLGITYSLSRMGFISCLASLLVMGTLLVNGSLSGGKKRACLVLLLFVVSIGFVFFPPNELILRFSDLSSTEKLATQDRFVLWTETLRLFADFPLFGCGLGAYESGLPRYKTSTAFSRDDYAHNDYLQLLAELGVFGLFMTGMLVLPLLFRAARAASDRRWEVRCLAIACVGSITALLIHSTVDFNLYVPANAMVFAWVLGVSASAAMIGAPSFS